MRRTILPLAALLFAAVACLAQLPTVYVGPGGYQAIQPAVIRACGMSGPGANVVISSSATPPDSIAAAQGCAAVFVIDQRATPAVTYSWNGKAYSTGSSGPVASTLLVPSAMVEYQFPGGTGATAIDLSGNGNTGTFAAAAPAWAASGLQFAAGQGVALPAAVNSARTFLFGVYVNPLMANGNASVVANQYPALLTSSGGATGLNLLYVRSKGTGDFQSYGQTYAPTIFANNSHITQSPQLVAGPNVIAYTLGTGGGDLDHVYINGIEVPYEVQGASAGLQTSGNFVLGSSAAGPWTSSGLNGVMVSFDAVAAELTPAQIADASGAVASLMLRHGLNPKVTLAQTATPTLTGIGDSITYGYPSTTPWLNSLTLTNQPAWAINNEGITGIQIQAIAGSAPYRDANFCRGASLNISTVLGGTNDIANGGATPEMAFAYLTSIVRTQKEAGCRVFVGTMLSRNGLDAQKDAYDALIITRIKQLGADGLIDFAANPALGADNAYSGSAFVDGVHPTPAYYAIMGKIASNALNYYFGSTAASPSTTSASAYTMLSGDRYLAITSASAGTALTAPDCTGPSGEAYTIENQSSAAGSITGMPSGGAAASANLYNYAADTQSTLVNENNGALTGASYSGYAATGFIKLLAGQPWSTNLAMGKYNNGGTPEGCAYYDISGAYLQACPSPSDSVQPLTLTAPSNGAAQYVQARFYYKLASSPAPATAGMVNEGSSVLPWVAYSAGTAGPTVQPVNGSTSTVTIPANTTLQLTDVANPKAVAGCHWTLR